MAATRYAASAVSGELPGFTAMRGRVPACPAERTANRTGFANGFEDEKGYRDFDPRLKNVTVRRDHVR